MLTHGPRVFRCLLSSIGSCLTGPDLITYAGTLPGTGGGSLTMGANGSGVLFNLPFLWFRSRCFMSDWTVRNDSSQSANVIIQRKRSIKGRPTLVWTQKGGKCMSSKVFIYLLVWHMVAACGPITQDILLNMGIL